MTYVPFPPERVIVTLSDPAGLPGSLVWRFRRALEQLYSHAVAGP